MTLFLTWTAIWVIILFAAIGFGYIDDRQRLYKWRKRIVKGQHVAYQRDKCIVFEISIPGDLVIISLPDGSHEEVSIKKIYPITDLLL